MSPSTWAVWGLLLFGLSAFVWLAVLSRASLSFAYPFASLTYALILLADRFLLHEQIPPLRWAGVFFIMLGIVLVAQTPPVTVTVAPEAAELAVVIVNYNAGAFLDRCSLRSSGTAGTSRSTCS